MLWSTSGCSAPRPDNLGLKNNLLLSCPKSPNCVLSQASDPKHQIHPIHYTSSVEIAKERLNQVILSMVAHELSRRTKSIGMSNSPHAGCVLLTMLSFIFRNPKH